MAAVGGLLSVRPVKMRQGGKSMVRFVGFVWWCVDAHSSMVLRSTRVLINKDLKLVLNAALSLHACVCRSCM